MHEVFVEGELKSLNRMRTKQTLHNVKDYHTSSEDVGKIAKISLAQKLVLTHFVPPGFNEKKLINKVKKDCFKFISSQETKTEKFKNKEKMIKSFLIPSCFWIVKKINKSKKIC